MTICWRITLLILFTSLFSSSIAQEYTFSGQHLTTEDGLSSLMTHAIYKDKKGFLWISTQHGLNRYDGYDFNIFLEEEIKLGGVNYRIDEDKSGNLWLYYWNTSINSPRTNEVVNINIFNPTTEKAVPISTYFEQQLPFQLSDLSLLQPIDPKKRQWFPTKKGQLFLYEDGQFKKIWEQAGLPIQYLTIDQSDNIWIGSGHTLIQLNSSGEVLESINLPNLVYGVWAGENNKTWIATKKLIGEEGHLELWSKTRGDTLKPFFLQKGPPLTFDQYHHFFLYRSQKGRWYLGLNGQLNLFNEKGKYLYNYSDLIDKDFKADFLNYLDSENLWLASPIGLIKTNATKVPFQLIHQRGPYSDCRGITEDELGNIYFLSGPMFQWNPKKQEVTQLSKQSGAHTLIYTDSLLWSGLYSGKDVGFHLDLATKEKKHYPILASPVTYAHLKTANPYEFLVGHERGLSYLDLKQQKLRPFTKFKNSLQDSLLKESSVLHFHKNNKGIWLATNNGIFLITEQQGILRHYNKSTNDLPFDHIRHIHEEKENEFWLATKGGGIIRWQPSFDEQPSISKQFTTKEGLSNNFTYAIYGDDYGNFWIPSDKGLMCMDKTSFQIRTFSTKDGLPHHEFNQSAHYQTKDGTLYFGGLGGLITFHPKVFTNSLSNKTAIEFTSYKLLEDEADELTDRSELLKSKQKIIIQPTDKFFELQFALLDFDLPKQHQYAYKIEGYSNQWTYINENYLRITSLPYGEYTLKIKGQNISKGWSGQELSLDIEVVTPFYLQWWFIISAITLTIGGIIAMVKWRFNSLERDRKRLETEVQKRTWQIEKDKQTISAQAEKLKQLDIAKTRFFSNITHEFRTPLTLIIGPLKQFIKANPAARHQLAGVVKNAQHLLSLINQLLDLSKLESGQMKVEVTHGDIVAYTRELTNRFIPLAQQKKQRICFVSNKESWKTNFDKDKWDKIVYNLLSNAIKFTPNAGVIQLSLLKTKINNIEHIQLEIKDTGRGIEKEQLEQIFNRFYQIDGSNTRAQEGTGIGLALVKELIEIQGGEIWVTSHIGEGTSFELQLPILVANKADCLSISAKMPVIPTLETITKIPPLTDALSATYQEEQKLQLLLIEDNAEMRKYIINCIDQTKYCIIEASDGEDGLEKAMTHIPDLIISDLMMPKKDGYEVTKTIRNTTSTSHIPVILLTAKAALESRLAGLRQGADAYLTKPFSPEELTLRIQKLIEIRLLLQKRFSQDFEKLPATKAFKKEDEFIGALKAYIIDNLNNLKLNGDMIGKNFRMSRMQLHRKLKALTNQSTTEYLKAVRLEVANQLVAEKKLSISEIAYQTGFSSPSHFSRTFKQKYGKAPSEMSY